MRSPPAAQECVADAAGRCGGPRHPCSRPRPARGPWRKGLPSHDLVGGVETPLSVEPAGQPVIRGGGGLTAKLNPGEGADHAGQGQAGDPYVASRIRMVGAIHHVNLLPEGGVDLFDDIHGGAPLTSARRKLPTIGATTHEHPRPSPMVPLRDSRTPHPGCPLIRMGPSPGWYPIGDSLLADPGPGWGGDQRWVTQRSKSMSISKGKSKGKRHCLVLPMLTA